MVLSLVANKHIASLSEAEAAFPLKEIDDKI